MPLCHDVTAPITGEIQGGWGDPTSLANVEVRADHAVQA